MVKLWWFRQHCKITYLGFLSCQGFLNMYWYYKQHNINQTAGNMMNHIWICNFQMSPVLLIACKPQNVDLIQLEFHWCRFSSYCKTEITTNLNQMQNHYDHNFGKQPPTRKLQLQGIHWWWNLNCLPYNKKLSKLCTMKIGLFPMLHIFFDPIYRLITLKRWDLFH